MIFCRYDVFTFQVSEEVFLQLWPLTQIQYWDMFENYPTVSVDRFQMNLVNKLDKKTCWNINHGDYCMS